uniref:Thaumatin-like protein n=1 Tax=Physcomitrium patens TaxID=3218 RepID=A0A7I3Z635_PHYPA
MCLFCSNDFGDSVALVASSSITHIVLRNRREQNAYNLPLMINPTFTNGGVRRGLHWGSPRFYIPFLDSFCKPPNRHTGPPGKGCINVVGPTTPRPTPSKAFKRACPSSYSYTLDDRNANPGVMYGCNVGSNYEVDFCP